MIGKLLSGLPGAELCARGVPSRAAAVWPRCPVAVPDVLALSEQNCC